MHSHSIGELHVISDQLTFGRAIDFCIAVIKNERLIFVSLDLPTQSSHLYLIASFNQTVLMHQACLLCSKSTRVVAIEGIVGVITHGG